MSQEVTVTTIAGTSLLVLPDVDDTRSVRQLREAVSAEIIAQGKLARVDLVLDGQVLQDSQLCSAILPPGRSHIQAVSVPYTTNELENLLQEHDVCRTLRSRVAKSLMHGGDYRLRTCAVKALVRMSGKCVCEVIEEALRTDSSEARNFLISTLGNLGTSAAPYIPDIASRLHDKDIQVCRSSAIALGKIGGAPVSVLVDALRYHRDHEVQKHVAHALASLGQSVVPHIRSLLSSSVKDETCDHVFGVIGTLGARAWPCVPELVGLLRKPTLRTRVESLLKRIGCPSDDEAGLRVATILCDADPIQRASAVDALVVLNKQQCHLERLVSMLRDPSEDVRVSAVRAIKKVGSPAISHVTPLLRDEDNNVRLSAARVMQSHTLNGGKLTAHHVAELARLLRDRDPHACRCAAISLRHVGSAALSYADDIAAILDAKKLDTSSIPTTLQQLDKLRQRDPDGLEGPVLPARCRHSTLRSMRPIPSLKITAGAIAQTSRNSSASDNAWRFSP